MKKIKLLLGIALVLIGWGCSGTVSNKQQPTTPQQEWWASNGKVKVLSTIAMIDDLVKEIGGEHVDSIVLIRGELDPHSYEFVKGDDEKFLAAKVIFYNGLGLEHGPSLECHLRKNTRAVSIGDTILRQHPDLILSIEGQTDPHIWMDVSLWAHALDTIVEKLSAEDPAHAEEFLERGKVLHAQMMEVHEKTFARLQGISEDKRYLVTSHDAFNYFTRAYLATPAELLPADAKEPLWKKRFRAPQGIAPDSDLGSMHIQDIIDYCAKYHVTVLFLESNVSPDSINAIVTSGRKKGLVLSVAEGVLYGDAMGGPGSTGDSYLKLIEHNAEVITTNLEGDICSS